MTKWICITSNQVLLPNGSYLQEGDEIIVDAIISNHYRFSFGHHDKLYLLPEILLNNFITLAEWRESQIDSILND